jgi:hypothetical protein
VERLFKVLKILRSAAALPKNLATLLALVLTLGLSSCKGTLSLGEDVEEGPGKGVASLSILAGNNQSGTIGTRLSVPFTIQARDSSGKPQAGVTIDWEIASGSGTLSALSSTTSSTGAAFVYLDLPSTEDSQSVVATLRGSDPELSVTFSSSATPSATIMDFSTANLNVTAGAPFSATVVFYDSFGNVRSDYVGSVVLQSSDAQGSVPGSYNFTSGPTIGTDNGAHTFSLTLRTAGPQSVTITDPSSGLTRSLLMNVTAAGASRLRITNALSAPSYSASAAISGLSVEALDPWDNLDKNYNRPVTVSLSPNPGSASLAGVTIRNSVAGRVSFSGLSVSQAGVGYKLKFDSTNSLAAPLISDSTSLFDIVAGAPASVTAVAGYPAQATVANSLGNISVLVRDAYLNPVQNIAIAWSSSNGGSFASATTLSGSNGIATNTYTLPTLAGNLTLYGTFYGGTPLMDSFSVVAKGGAAASFAVSGHTSPSAAGVQRSVTVTAKDSYGNLASDYAGTVALTSSDAQFVPPANAGLTDSTGTFNVTLKSSGTQSITATDTVSSSITGSQSGISVTPLAASQFVVSGFPSPVNSYTGGTVTVRAIDTFNNTATGYAGSVNFTSSDGEAVLPANSGLSSGQGVFSVTFKNPGTQSITATDTVSSSVTGTQSGITVRPGPAVSFSVTGFSATPTAGVAGSVTVTARDLYGKVATGYTGTVHLTSTDGNAVLAADSTLTDGVGTFAVTLKTAGSQSITATDTLSGSITGSQSGIVVGASTLYKAAFTTLPRATATSAQPLNPVIQAQDSFGNPIKSALAMQLGMYGASDCSGAPASGSLSVTVGTSDANGNWAPAGVKFSGTGSLHLRAAVSGGTQVACTPVTISAPVADPALSTVVVSAGSAKIGASSIAVTVNVRDDESNPIANMAVVVSSNRGASDLISTVNANTNAAGQAVFYINSSALGRALLSATAGGVTLDLKPIVYFLYDNPMGDFTAASAEAGMTPGTNSPFFTSSWRNRAGSAVADAALGGFAMNSSSGWNGNGGTASVSDPYQLRFDGTTSSQVNLGRAAMEAGLIEAFVRMPSSINTDSTRGRVILTNSSAINSGFTLRHSNRGAVQIAASQALKLELVNGSQSYSDLILGDGATRYWVDPTSTSLDEARSGTSLQSVGANNVNEGGFGNYWGCRDYGCGEFGTVWANSYPSQGVSMKHFVSGGYSYSTTDIPATSSGALSVEAWTRFQAGSSYELGTHPSGTEKAVIASKRNGSGLVWVLYALQGKLYWEIGGQTLVSTSSVTQNNWYHVAVTQSGATASLYINGALDSQSTFSSFTLSDAAAPVSIGRDSVLTSTSGDCWSWGGTCTFRGFISHVALYEKALSLSEVSSHYAARVAEACEISELPRADEWQYLSVWSGSNTGLIASIITSTSGVAGNYAPSRCRVSVSPVVGATRAFKTSSEDLVFGSSLSSSKLWQGSVGEIRSFPISSVLRDDATTPYAEDCRYNNHPYPQYRGWQHNSGTIYPSEAECEAAYKASFILGLGYPAHYDAEKGSYP